MRATDRQFHGAALAVLALSALVAGVSLGREAPSSHEIFVLQSARNMADRGDWVVPFFNGEPRLTKPPLNYWLTAAVAWASGHDRPTAFDGRLPSALAGVWLAGMTLWLGWRLFTPSVGVSAGLVLAGCMGFLRYAHSARPEMTYAAACGTAIALFAQAWRGRGRWRWAAGLGVWACFGIATLAKGPHIPALLAVGFAVALLRGSKRARPAGSGGIAHAGGGEPRPRRGRGVTEALTSRWPVIVNLIAGLAIFLAIALPWWWLVRSRVGAATVDQSQLTGSRFMLSPWNVFDPYYLYRPWVLVLPWVVLFPFAAILGVWRTRYGFAARWLGLLILIAVVVMSFGGDKRWYYMLPYLSPACVLLALGARWAWNRLPRQWPRRGERIIVGAVGIALAGGYAAAAALGGAWGMSGLGAGVALAGAAWWIARPLGGAGDVPLAGNRLWLGVVAAVALTLVAIKGSGLIDSAHELQRNRLGELAAAMVPSSAPLVAYRLEAAYPIYHTNRPIPTLDKLDQLRQYHGPTVWVLYPSTVKAETLARWHIEAVRRVADCDDHHQAWIVGRTRVPGSLTVYDASARVRHKSRS